MASRPKEVKVQPSPNLSELLAAAQTSKTRAYAPYSHYSVGAAILGADGHIYVGCNVENSSYGLTACAERNALGAMVAAGCTEVAALVVVTQDGGTPCGICRQALIEFAPHGVETIPITCADASGNLQTYALREHIRHARKLKQSYNGPDDATSRAHWSLPPWRAQPPVTTG